MSLSRERLSKLLHPFLRPGDADLSADADDDPGGAYLSNKGIEQFQIFLELLLHWNARMNLTAVRDPEEIVTRHFGESLFLAAHLAPLLRPGDTVLDFGSGAGFPGLPLQILCPELRVTLAESQGKKASFLKEAIRTLDLADTQVWAGRVEALPEGQRFAAVTLRAVDRLPLALREAEKRVRPGGYLAALVGENEAAPRDSANLKLKAQIPQTRQRSLVISSVP